LHLGWDTHLRYVIIWPGKQAPSSSAQAAYVSFCTPNGSSGTCARPVIPGSRSACQHWWWARLQCRFWVNGLDETMHCGLLCVFAKKHPLCMFPHWLTCTLFDRDPAHHAQYASSSLSSSSNPKIFLISANEACLSLLAPPASEAFTRAVLDRSVDVSRACTIEK
jgi:hypothetical protein